MKRMILLLTLLTLALPPVLADDITTAKDRETVLFARTTPSGAKVTVDGKAVGSTDDMFRVEPGVRRIVIELDGHEQENKQMTIQAGRVSRLVLKLKKRSTKAGSYKAGGFLGPDRKVPAGWTLLKRLDVPADQTAAIAKRLGGKIDKLANDVFIVHGQRVQINLGSVP